MGAYRTMSGHPDYSALCAWSGQMGRRGGALTVARVLYGVDLSPEFCGRAGYLEADIDEVRARYVAWRAVRETMPSIGVDVARDVRAVFGDLHAEQRRQVVSAALHADIEYLVAATSTYDERRKIDRVRRAMGALVAQRITMDHEAEARRLREARKPLRGA